MKNFIYGLLGILIIFIFFILSMLSLVLVGKIWSIITIVGLLGLIIKLSVVFIDILIIFGLFILCSWISDKLEYKKNSL